MAILEPIADSQWNRSCAAHLLWRAGLGGTTEQLDVFEKLTPKEAVRRLMAPGRKPSLPDFSKILDDTTQEEKDLRTISQDKTQSPESRREARQMSQRIRNRQITSLRDTWSHQLLETKEPFVEKLCLFWHNHFAVSDEKNDYRTLNQYLKLLRTQGLGSFGDLLIAISKNPAMLNHLDNVNNVKGKPNENYARELMELFSLGIGHYNEDDVLAGARAFTGWTYKRSSNVFEFREKSHDFEEKTFLGQTGNWNGEDIVRIILEQPACSRFLAFTIWDEFVDYNPKPEVIEELATTIRQEKYAVGPVLERVFLSRGFYAPEIRGRHVKAPFQLVPSSIRLMRMKDPPTELIVDTMKIMGQELTTPPDVDGWPIGRRWINTSTLLMRYNFANYLTHGTMPKSVGKRWRYSDTRKYNPKYFLEQIKSRRLTLPQEITDFFIGHFIQREISDPSRRKLIAYIQKDRAGGRANFDPRNKTAEEKIRGLIHLVMSSPDYQLC